jgi:hypothetical protein
VLKLLHLRSALVPRDGVFIVGVTIFCRLAIRRIEKNLNAITLIQFLVRLVPENTVGYVHKEVEIASVPERPVFRGGLAGPGRRLQY